MKWILSIAVGSVVATVHFLHIAPINEYGHFTIPPDEVFESYLSVTYRDFYREFYGRCNVVESKCHCEIKPFEADPPQTEFTPCARRPDSGAPVDGKCYVYVVGRLAHMDDLTLGDLCHTL